MNSARTPGSDKGKPEELDATSGERGECGVGKVQGRDHGETIKGPSFVSSFSSKTKFPLNIFEQAICL